MVNKQDGTDGIIAETWCIL